MYGFPVVKCINAYLQTHKIFWVEFYLLSMVVLIRLLIVHSQNAFANTFDLTL